MELFFIVAIIVVCFSILLLAAFVNEFLKEFKKEDKNVGYIEGLIVYRP